MKFIKFTLLPLLLLSFSSAFAAELPFTDVSKDASWYADLKSMYDAGVISDTKDHLFRPEGLLPRDEFVGIVVGVGCRKCVYPTVEDILKYRTDPFVDIMKQNQYFYCISYAKEQGIVQGYTLDASGKTQCQNNEAFTSVPFCPANNISRIEAAAVLLRQANLWNETLNSAAFEKRQTIADVDTYWYGYAQKAIEAGLIKISSDKKVAPNEYITRQEFVIMAAKIFHMNLCEIKTDKTKSDFSSTIFIFDREKNSCPLGAPETKFPNLLETVYDFKGYGKGTGEITYEWEFFNSSTNETLRANGACLDNYDLVNAGVWYVKLRVSDSVGNSTLSYRQITVSKEKSYDLSVAIQGRPIDGLAPMPVDFTSTVGRGIGPYTYLWDFGDESYSSEANPSHVFNNAGVYTVRLTVRDTKTGNIGFAELVVHATENPDRDGDQILNGNDFCPDVYGSKQYFGCPRVDEYAIGAITDDKCLTDKIAQAGAIQGRTQCTSCPCAYSFDFVSALRSCDIIFPTILSPDKKTIYSRGSVYQVR